MNLTRGLDERSFIVDHDNNDKRSIERHNTIQWTNRVYKDHILLHHILFCYKCYGYAMSELFDRVRYIT